MIARLSLLAFLALIAILYFPVVLFPFLAWDDTTYILNNPLVTNYWQQPLLDRLLTPYVGYIVPITVLVEASLFSLGSGTPWTFHLANLLLHLAVLWSLYRVMRALDRPTMISLAAVSLFAAHPIVVEPVAWATGIKDLLMAAFALAATRQFILSLGPARTKGCWSVAVTPAFFALLSIFIQTHGCPDRPGLAGILIIPPPHAARATSSIRDRSHGRLARYHHPDR